MITGIGTDIVRIDRIERIFKKYGEVFLKRILNKLEIEKINLLPIYKKVNFLAKRFAGKEAISKALGTGIASGLQFKDIIIDNDELGKPYANIITNCRNNIKTNLKIHLSFADDYPSAIAFAIVSI